MKKLSQLKTRISMKIENICTYICVYVYTYIYIFYIKNSVGWLKCSLNEAELKINDLEDRATITQNAA